MERNVLKNLISSKLNEQFIQKWFSLMNNSPRGLFHLEYKRGFGIEKYLVKLNSYDRAMIAKLRCSNIQFPIETGRWNGCLNMKECVLSVETELEMNSIICSSVKNRKLKPLGKSSFLYITRNIQPN